jgi:integrase
MEQQILIDDETLEGYLESLNIKELSLTTKKWYIKYGDKFQEMFPYVMNHQQLKDNIRHFLSVYNNSIAKATILNLLEFMEIDDIRIPKVTGRKSDIEFPQIDEEQMKPFFDALYQRKKLYGIAGEVCYYCALRWGELTEIKKNNLGLDKWYTEPTKTCELKIVKGIAKNKKERITLIPPEIAGKVLEYISLIEDKNENFFEKNVLFPLKKSQWNRVLHKVGKEVFGEDINIYCHLLRHLRSQHLREVGFDVDDIKTILGHSNISTTQLYLHTNKKKVLTKLENFYQNKDKVDFSLNK